MPSVAIIVLRGAAVGGRARAAHGHTAVVRSAAWLVKHQKTIGPIDPSPHPISIVSVITVGVPAAIAWPSLALKLRQRSVGSWGSRPKPRASGSRGGGQCRPSARAALQRAAARRSAARHRAVAARRGAAVVRRAQAAIQMQAHVSRIVRRGKGMEGRLIWNMIRAVVWGWVRIEGTRVYGGYTGRMLRGDSAAVSGYTIVSWTSHGSMYTESARDQSHAVMLILIQD